MGSALASHGSLLELADTGSAGHGGNFWKLITEATPAIKTLPCKPMYFSARQLDLLQAGPAGER